MKILQRTNLQAAAAFSQNFDCATIGADGVILNGMSVECATVKLRELDTVGGVSQLLFNWIAAASTGALYTFRVALPILGPGFNLATTGVNPFTGTVSLVSGLDRPWGSVDMTQRTKTIAPATADDIIVDYLAGQPSRFQLFCNTDVATTFRLRVFGPNLNIGTTYTVDVAAVAGGPAVFPEMLHGGNTFSLAATNNDVAANANIKVHAVCNWD